ncbi:MAG: hypothetical protein ACI9VT_001371 [Psychroserpens sp.]|jgi:hypothetical protein
MHYQLNPKIFRMRIDDFYEFPIILEMPDSSVENRNKVEKKIIAELRKKYKGDKDFKEKLEAKGLGLAELSASTIKQTLIKGGFSLSIDLLASVIPGRAFLSAPAKSLLGTLQAKI